MRSLLTEHLNIRSARSLTQRRMMDKDLRGLLWVLDGILCLAATGVTMAIFVLRGVASDSYNRNDLFDTRTLLVLAALGIWLVVLLLTGALVEEWYIQWQQRKQKQLAQEAVPQPKPRQNPGPSSGPKPPTPPVPPQPPKPPSPPPLDPTPSPIGPGPDFDPDPHSGAGALPIPKTPVRRLATSAA